MKDEELKIGYVFGDRTIISEQFMEGKLNYFLTKCKCGSISKVQKHSIKLNRSTKCRKCANEYMRHDITNMRFGKLVAKKYIGKIDNKHSKWEIHCDCGNICYIDAGTFEHGKRTSCGCVLRSTGQRHRAWRGCESIPKSVWGSCKTNAAKYDREFSLSIEYMSEVFERQNRKCALSGIELYFNSHKDKNASLDRIDSSKGYIEGNVQWVHKDVNRIKTDLNQEWFIELCCNIADNIRSKTIVADN